MSKTNAHNFIVVLGRKWRDGRFDPEPPQCLKEQINNTLIISTPDASNLNDTHMLDLMALTFPGPHLFLVVLEDGKQPEGELRKWQGVFGEDISHNMRYITEEGYNCNPVNCIIIDDVMIEKCKHIIKQDNHYSFVGFLKRKKKQIEKEMRTGLQVSSSPPSGGLRKSPQLTLVLLGESGSGKSASGNTILGVKAFTSKSSSISVTTECEMKPKSISGTEVKIIDTPDLSDEDLQEQSRHIEKCIWLCGSGLCVYLLAIQIGRFTEGERDILERLEKALQTRVRDRAIILFTHGDDLTSHIDDYARNTDTHLQQLIVNCGKRYQVISNSTSHKREAEKQVKELMGKIAELVETTYKVKVFPENVAEKSSCVII